MRAKADHKAHQHQCQYKDASGHVAAERVDFRRIAGRNPRHHEGAERERSRDQQRKKPVQHHQYRMIARGW